MTRDPVTEREPLSDIYPDCQLVSLLTMSRSSSDVLREPIGIIGAGSAGLINAHILLQDGFTDVTLISRDKSVGGTWMRDRVYQGLYINK